MHKRSAFYTCLATVAQLAAAHAVMIISNILKGWQLRMNFNPHEIYTQTYYIQQDACTGVHSACRREENGLNLDICATPSTAHTGADAGISWS